MTTWRMWAQHTDQGTYEHLYPSRSVVEFYGSRYPIVEVDVEEVAPGDESGTHWGWLHRDMSTREWKDAPTMIWPRLFQLEMCFPYTLDVAEQRGRGRRVRLRITPVEAEA